MKNRTGEGTEIHLSGIKFVFLDRDGVINRKAPEGSYVTSWRDVEMLPGVERAIALLNQTGRKVILVTNQRGIALGRMSVAELADIHANLRAHLGSFGAAIDAIYFCPHDVGQCSCRKPGTGLFESAFKEYPEASPQNSVMIGDSESDMIAGAKMGMRTIFIASELNASGGLSGQATNSARSLLEAVETYLCE